MLKNALLFLPDLDSLEIECVPFDCSEDVSHVADLAEIYLGEGRLRAKILQGTQRKSIAYSILEEIFKLRSLGYRRLSLTQKVTPQR